MQSYGLAAQQPALSRVVFYGHLRRQFGREVELHVRSPRDAVRALMYVLPGFTEHIAKHNEPGYKIYIGQRQILFTGDAQHDFQEIQQPSGLREIRIVPYIGGSKKGGLTGIVIGAALIAFAVWTGGAGMGLLAAAQTTTPILSMAGSIAFSLGVSMVLGGISQALAKSPESQSLEKSDNKPSYVFDGAVNTVAQGNPVPIFYGGPMIVGSQVISTGISTAQIPIDEVQVGTTQTAPDPTAPAPNVGDYMEDNFENWFQWDGNSWEPSDPPPGGGD